MERSGPRRARGMPPLGWGFALGLAALTFGRWLYVLRLGRRPVEYAGYRLTRVTVVARRR